MNDILPKPFTKEGLLDMLEVGEMYFDFWVCWADLFFQPTLETLDAPQSNPTNVEASAINFCPYVWATFCI
jgi:hypothetical protein